MKKGLSFLLMTALMILIFSLPISAETEGDFQYRVQNEKATITNYTGNATNLVIPLSLGGYSVTEIGEVAFENCTSLTSVTIPNSVIYIGMSAFRGCKSLTSVTIPNSVTEIGLSPFDSCASLTSINVDEANTAYSSDESGALFNKNKTWLIKFPEGSKQETYVIPDSVIEIEWSAFSGCTSLTSINVPKNNQNYSSDNSGVLFNKNKTELLQYPIGRDGAYTIPNSVTEISGRAFYGCKGLTSVTIANSITKIKDWAFWGCTSLVSVDIPNSVTIIGAYAFDGCTSLKSVTIPNSVAVIGESAFFNCTSLTSVTIPNSVIYIGMSAFCGCKSLTSVTIPNSVAEIQGFAFSNCISLTSVTIPDSVAEIGMQAFAFCTSLGAVTIPNSVTVIEGDAFSGCTSLTSINVDEGNSVYSSDDRGVLFNRNKTRLISCPEGKQGTYVVPNSVTEIGSFAFSNCVFMTSVTIPNSVMEIGGAVFYGCTNLTSVAIPNSVTMIGGNAFYGCKDLTIYGYSGSYAEAYANNEKIPFKVTAKFGDVPANAWYVSYVYDLVDKSILDGKSAGIFDPEGKITRAEFAKILAYASGDDLVPYDKECVFADSRNHWSKKNINWAYEHQIVNGKGNGFDPDANISRQEMAVMINRYADYKQITLPQTVAANTFNDDAEIAGWARKAVSAMQQANIINGRPGNIFDPQGNAQRCEAAKMISIFLSL